jgi:hypothetical protein
MFPVAGTARHGRFMSFRRKSLTAVVPVLALVAIAAFPFTMRSGHHQARPASLAVYVAPAQLDTMQVSAGFRLTAVRKEVAREVRAEALARQRAMLLAERQRAIAVSAARARVAAAARLRQAAPAASEAVYSYAGIEALWLAAGGNPAYAATAACIAEHESGGRANAVSPTDDFGVFQEHADPAALNPQVSAVTAVRMSSNGTNWSAWTTSGYC